MVWKKYYVEEDTIFCSSSRKQQTEQRMNHPEAGSNVVQDGSPRMEGGQLPPLVSLKCTLCMQFFKEPLTLACLHSFCSGCLEKYTKETGRRDNAFGCPTCVNALGQPETNAATSEPFRNTRLERIVKLVLDKKILCENCCTPTSSTYSDVHCDTCDAFLCLSCWSGTHDKHEVFRTHIRQPLRISEMTDLPQCRYHPENTLDFFCPEEGVGVCQSCLLVGDFIGKPYRVIKEVRSEHQERVMAGLGAVAVDRKRLLSGKGAVKLKNEELENNYAKQKQRIEAEFALARKMLQEREREALDSLAKVKAAKQQILQQQDQSIDRTLALVDDCVANANLVVNFSNDQELVELSEPINVRVGQFEHIKRTAPRTCKDCAKRKLECHCPAIEADLPVRLGSAVEMVDKFCPRPLGHP